MGQFETFLKSCLGFSVSNGYTIKSQDQKGKLRPDLVIYKADKPIFVIEVKKLGFDFEKSDFRSGKVQLKEYLSTFEDVPYGFLCNGYEWKLYDFSNKQNAIEIQKVSFRNDGVLYDTSKRQVEEICYDFTSFHEYAFSTGEWADLSKEATAFSPDSLAKAILSAGVMKVITKEIRGEHEFKACTDLLYEKVYNLLSFGLDDSLKASFNPEKKAEFEKYIKGQMRQARKSKKAPKVTAEATSPLPTIENIVEEDNTSAA
ncbi:MAG: type I restriction endonuclease [Flavobacterium sp.]